MHLHFSLLDETSAISKFSCGEEELDLFLKSSALLFRRRHFGVTIICSDAAGTVIGYYTLCPACIQRERLPEKFLTGPRPNPIPAFRICRLAISKHYQGKGYGKMLFVHALKKCWDQAKQIGGSIVIIDAKKEHTREFYQRFGFISLPENSLILVQTIKYLEHHFLV